MKHIPGKISHRPLMEIMNVFLKPKWGKLQISREESKLYSCRCKPSGTELDFTFSYSAYKDKPPLKVGTFLKKIPFQTSSHDLVLENLFLGTRTLTSFIGSCSQIYTRGYSKMRKYYYRLIIPLSRKLDFYFQLEDAAYHTDLGYRSRAGVIVTIEGEDMYACVIHYKKQHFLSIESREKQGFELFSRKANALKNGLGYLSGHLAGNNGYYFAYQKQAMEFPEHFYFAAFRSEIIHLAIPVHANPFAYVRNKRMAEKYHQRKLLRKVNQVELSTLCQKLFESTLFESCLVLIMEAGAASLLFRPGGYAIALETLSDLITEKSKVKLSPIKSKPLSKLIREECKAIISKYGQDIAVDDLKTLNTRIEQLNQQTNKARLRAPFELLGIPLLEADIAILETRNDLLHGRHPDISNAGPSRTERRLNLDLYYASTRFYTLLSMLILKWVGFDNYVINHPFIQSGVTGIKVRERPYRRV